MRRRAFELTLLFCAVSLSPAFAAGASDIDFARALAQRGYYDLAEDQCGRILGSSKTSADDRAAVLLIQADIKQSQAGRAKDAESAQILINEAVAILQKFLEGNPRHPLVNDAILNMAWLKRKVAEIVTASLAAETDPAKIEEQRRRALQLYGEVEKYYTDWIAALKSGKNAEANEGPMMDAILDLNRTKLMHARVPGADDATKKQLLERVLTDLDEFQFDYGDRPISFEAIRIEGECYLELGDTAAAETRFRSAMSLGEKMREGGMEPAPAHLDIIRSALRSLAALTNRMGRPQETISLVDQAFKDDKPLATEPVGYELMLHKAQALFDLGDVAGANQLANKVLQLDPNGRMGYLARDKIRKWVGEAQSEARLSPEQFMTAADSFMEKGEWPEACQSLRRCIDASGTTAEREKFGAVSYHKLGLCLFQLGRYYEAASAYEKVFSLYPSSELAPKCCFETARCYSNEFALSGDKRDEDDKDRALATLLEKWKEHPAARNVAFLQAERMENTKDFGKAADLYLRVQEVAEAYESALVRAGICFYQDAALKWSKEKKRSDAIKAEVAAGMMKGLKAIEQFRTRVNDPAFTLTDAELLRVRQQNSFLAVRQMALIYTHEAVGRPQDGIKCLEECAASIPPDDERLARLWDLEIRAYLTTDQLDKAVQLLDLMFERFPDGVIIAQACKSVAIRLHKSIADRLEKSLDDPKVRENAARVAKYYMKWINDGLSRGLTITAADMLSVADTLYLIAKQLNDLDPAIVSFMDLQGKTPSEPHFFGDVAFVLALMTDDKFGKLSDKDAVDLMVRLARCQSFMATASSDWQKAKKQYTDLIKKTHLLDVAEHLDTTVLEKYPTLLSAYLELGCVYTEEGKKPSQKFQFDNALTIFGNVADASQNGTESWWIAKYMMIQTLYLRGAGSDANLAVVSLQNLERNYPDFDGGKYGIKAKLLELMKKLPK